MTQYVSTPTKSFPAGAALEANRRVKLASGVLQYAGASDVSIGVLLMETFADSNFASGYSNGTVLLTTAQGTKMFVASDAITAANPFYAAANGKVASTGTIVEGRAFTASTADNDIIEGMSIANTDVSATINGTNAAAFKVDADAATPKIELSGQSGGSGDFTTTLKPEATLSGNNTIIVPEANGDTLVAVALAQTLTSKTLTAPVIGGGLTASGSAANTFAGSTGTFITSTGLNTLSGYAGLKVNATPVAAAGSTVADAGALASANIAKISSDGATKGVKLPTGVAGQFQIVENTTSTACELYAASGGTVNGLSADASVVIPASKGVLCLCFAADTWIVYDLPAKATAS